MKAEKGKIVGINKTSHDVPGAVRLTKDTNIPQLVSGNNVTVYTDGSLNDDMIFKIGITMIAHEAESCVIVGEDWPFSLRFEDKA